MAAQSPIDDDAALLVAPAAKRALRAQVLTARDALPATVRAAAAARIVDALLAMPSFLAARVVFLTLPFGSEWNSRGVAHAALAAGKKVVLPRVDRSSGGLELRLIGDPDTDVVAGYRGIPEPAPGTDRIATAAVDWVLVPGVAFDAAGRRLGYGGGYYDRLLPLLSPAVARIAGAFELQVVARVPTEAHDARVDRLVTEAGVVDVVQR